MAPLRPLAHGALILLRDRAQVASFVERMPLELQRIVVAHGAVLEPADRGAVRGVSLYSILGRSLARRAGAHRKLLRAVAAALRASLAWIRRRQASGGCASACAARRPRTIFLHASNEIAHASATPEGGAEIALRASRWTGGARAHGRGLLPAGELELALAFRARYSAQLDSTHKVVVASGRT